MNTKWNVLMVIALLAMLVGGNVGRAQAQSVITFSPEALPKATVGIYYEQILSVSGVTRSGAWSYLANTLPLDMSVGDYGNDGRGAISGVPEETGTFTFNVFVRDYDGSVPNGYTEYQHEYTLVIEKATTTVLMFDSINPTMYGGGFEIKAHSHFTEFSYPPGTFAFYLDDSLVTGCDALPVDESNLSTASCWFPGTLAAGDHDIRAVYSPTDADNYNGSEATLTHTVGYKIDGTLFSDANNNGTRDEGEVTLGGYYIGSDRLCDGSVEETAYSSPDGMYSFPALDPDHDYCLQFTLAGVKFVQTTPTGKIYLNENKDVPVGVYIIYVKFSPDTLPAGEKGVAYQQQITVGGGIPPYTITVDSTKTSLPEGMSFDPSTGMLSGTPTQAGVFSLVLNAEDAEGNAAREQNYTLLIPGDGVFNFTSSPNPSAAGEEVTFTVSATGDAVMPGVGSVPPIGTVSFYDGATAIGDCSGIYLNVDLAAQQLGDIPAVCKTSSLAPGNHEINAVYTDPTSVYGDVTLTLDQQVGLTISPDTLPDGTFAAYYSQQLTVSGGSGSYSFSLTGTLPAGMALTGDTLSGTPTEKGAFPITIKAVGVSDQTLVGQREYILTIGMLDLSFGTNGRVITDLQRTHHVASNSALQPDGKIVVLGNIGYSDGVQLERYNQDGTLDTQFGSNGLVTTLPGDIGGATSVDSRTVAIAPDGHILVSASVFEETTSSTYFTLIRYNADGSLDAGFGGGGFLTLNIPTPPAGYSGVDWAEEIGVDYQQDGKIIVAATLLPEMNPVPKQGLLMRLHEADGAWTLDPSFGTNGIATFLEAGVSTVFRGLDILATGEIVVGFEYVGTYPDWGSSVLRYSADGVLAQEYANRAAGDVSAVRGLPDGTVYALGSIHTPADVLLVRYLPTGEIDTSGFGTDGEVMTKFAADLAVCSSLLVQPDGKPVLACYYVFEAPSYHSFFAVARFNTDGTPDDSFFTGGVFATPFDDPGDPTTVHGAQSVHLTPEGKLLATGYIGLDEEGDRAVLAQYNIGVAVGPGEIAAGTVGTPYTQTFTATGGIAPYTFSIVGGSLPAGLTLGSDGLLYGTPTEAGSFPVTIQAAGSGGPQGSKEYILTILRPSADLRLTKTDSKDPVKPGAQLAYTLTVKNLGPDAAQTITLVDTLDRNTKYVSVVAPRGWSCKYANYAVTCTGISLASGSTATIKITVAVGKTARLGKDLVNNATVSSATYDPLMTNNSVVQKTLVSR